MRNDVLLLPLYISKKKINVMYAENMVEFALDGAKCKWYGTKMEDSVHVKSQFSHNWHRVERQ